MLLLVLMATVSEIQAHCPGESEREASWSIVSGGVYEFAR